MIKRILCLFLAMTLALGLCPALPVSAWEWKPSSRSGPGELHDLTSTASPLMPMVSAETTEEYLALCEGFPSYLTIRTDTECRLWSMPCDDLVCSNSQSLGLTNDGDILTVTGLYRNTEDKYWYQVSWNGAVCYLYCPNVTVEEFLSFDLETTGLCIPGGGTHTLGGTVSSRYNEIAAVRVQVQTSDTIVRTAEQAVAADCFDLEALALDLSELEPGVYTLLLSITAISHFSTDGETMETRELTLEAVQTTFTIADDGHICDKGTLLAIGEAHPHYSLYQCSICGGAVTGWEETHPDSGCELCRPGKPELKVLALLDGAVTCTWTDTPNSAYAELILMARDSEGSWTELERISPAASGWQRTLEPGAYRIRLCVWSDHAIIGCTWADDVYFTIEYTADDLVYDGVDISLWQEDPDWETVKESTDYIIIRCGYGTDNEDHDDERWYENADACVEHGIPFGVYLYSYALTDEHAVSEAEHVLRLVEGYDPDLPIYLDMEDYSIEKKISPKQMLRNATIFCNILEEAGYTVGIYANWAWWYYYMTQDTFDRWSIWVAQYASKCSLEREYDQWQYTDSGRAPGFKTIVDKNYWYGALPGANHVHCYQANVLIRPTCLSEGLQECICPCGESYEEILPISDHTYGDWTILLEPTLQTEGLREHTCLDCGETFQQVMDRLPLPFTDVQLGSYCYEPIVWALLEGVTSGVSADTFAPNMACTRGQVVTFLWRAAGQPEPTVTEHPFTDVRDGAFYHKAMLWAVENGITSGMTADTFGPEEPCTRGQVVAFLHRASGKPEPSITEHPFTDVSQEAFYYRAMLWAVENGITSGTSPDTFAPDVPCTRGQVVTFLYRTYSE